MCQSQGVKELEEMLNLPVESQIVQQAIMALASAQEEKKKVSALGTFIESFYDAGNKATWLS